MHVSSVLASAIILLGTTTGVSATCHRSGITWPDQFDARIAAYNACKTVFQGTFAPKERRTYCYNGRGNVKFEFAIANENDHEGFDLNDGHCVDGLSNEILGCSMGGVSHIAGWEFSSDPNEGKC
ncbi:hypothetical protein FSARC_14726 [Fusarium sarcochroum]|uniref:Glycan binding protein Y3-like domain-containing protein n=1 Tax=Fusarium sarcochroum TaxID=1208366 RepID=A0A8H4SR33_9HYPO|nr:hypothetical protein FSARC_14726 [Fusarium sarcochroum]